MIPVISDLFVATISLVIATVCAYEIGTSGFDLSIALLALLALILLGVFGRRVARAVSQIRSKG